MNLLDKPKKTTHVAVAIVATQTYFLTAKLLRSRLRRYSSEFLSNTTRLTLAYCLPNVLECSDPLLLPAFDVLPIGLVTSIMLLELNEVLPAEPTATAAAASPLRPELRLDINWE